MKKSLLAYIAITVKSIIYGLSILFTSRLLKNEGIFDVLALRFLVSLIFLQILKLFKVIKVNFKGKNLKAVFLLVIFEPIGYFIFETIGISYTSTLMVSIILSLMPVAVVIAETLILKETTSFIQKLYLIMGVTGAAFIAYMSSANSGDSELLGIIFIVLAMVCGCLYLVFSRKFSVEFNPLEITYYMVIAGAIIFNLTNIFIHLLNGTITSYFTPLFNLQNIVGFIYLGVLASICATMLNNFALSKIQASSASVFSKLSTIVAVLAGILVNNESFYWYHLLGGALILAGAVGTSFSGHKTPEKSAIEEGSHSLYKLHKIN